VNRRTVEQLTALNREFYRSRAAEFDASRRSPWPGWARVLQSIDPDGEVSILDVGCGNGRFGIFAEETLARGVSYCGVDSSSELLAAARSRGPSRWRLIEGDILRQLLPGNPGATGFDLVCCFGVMHHIPGGLERRALLEKMAACLAPGGRLAVSFWQFGGDERFRRRVLPWSEAVSAACGEIDPLELEPGDFLLRWGDADGGDGERSTALRYCHYCDPQQAERLVEQADLEPLETFRADGRSGDLNLYFLLTRRG